MRLLLNVRARWRITCTQGRLAGRGEAFIGSLSYSPSEKRDFSDCVVAVAGRDGCGTLFKDVWLHPMAAVVIDYSKTRRSSDTRPARRFAAEF